MKTTSELMATIAECRAKVSPMIADEQWVDRVAHKLGSGR